MKPRCSREVSPSQDRLSLEYHSFFQLINYFCLLLPFSCNIVAFLVSHLVNPMVSICFFCFTI